jgi:hypothetical protein
MHGVTKVGSSIGTGGKTLHEEESEFVRSIADQLRPWKLPESDVVAKINKAICGLRSLLKSRGGPFTKEFKASAEKQFFYAKRQCELLDATTLPQGFLRDVQRSTCKCYDKTRLPVLDIHKKQSTAVVALCLMVEVSTKYLAAGTRYTPYCVVASRLFEIITGEHEPNLQYACKRVLRLCRDPNTRKRGIWPLIIHLVYNASEADIIPVLLLFADYHREYSPSYLSMVLGRKCH